MSFWDEHEIHCLLGLLLPPVVLEVGKLKLQFVVVLQVGQLVLGEASLR